MKRKLVAFALGFLVFAAHKWDVNRAYGAGVKAEADFINKHWLCIQIDDVKPDSGLSRTYPLTPQSRGNGGAAGTSILDSVHRLPHTP